MADAPYQFLVKLGAYPKEDIAVAAFVGHEALSRPFRYEITLSAEKSDLDFEKVMEKPATLIIKTRQGEIRRHGVPAAFEQAQTVHGRTVYRLDLVPRLALLEQLENSRVFLDKSVKEILTEVLSGAGLKVGLDIEFRLTCRLEPREYVVQYRESDFAFLSRWMEREGMYLFIEHGQDREKYVITDSRASHEPQAVASKLRYAPRSGLDQGQADVTVSEFSVAATPLPKTVRLKDWNYRTPAVDLEAEQEVVESGFGCFYGYGDHFNTMTEGKALAKIRAEAFACRQRIAAGGSFSPYFDPGFTFRLEDHPRSDFNQDYLTIGITRSGRQHPAGLARVEASDRDGQDDEPYYRCEFTAIPHSAQFRPERQTPWPRLPGVVNAVVDGPSSGQYPDIDDAGRYKVIAAFDRSGRKDGKASSWIRMAQPYGGTDHGLACPLHKGCEVLLVHLDGDPDRPIIMAAVPNPDNPSPVAEANQTKCRLTTAGGNELHFEDQKGSERILFNVPSSSSYMRLGAPNDPPPPADGDWTTWSKIDPNKEKDGKKSDEGRHGWKLQTPDWISIIAGAQFEMYMIGYISSVIGLYQDSAHISKTELNPAFVQKFYVHKAKNFPGEQKNTLLAKLFCGSRQQIDTSKQHLTATNQEISGQINELSGPIQELHTQVTTLGAQNNELSTQISQLAQTKQELIGQINSIDQARTELLQQNSDLAGQVSAMAQSQILLGAQVNDLNGQVSAMAQTVTQAAGQTTATALQVQQNALTHTRMHGVDLTL